MQEIDNIKKIIDTLNLDNTSSIFNNINRIIKHIESEDDLDEVEDSPKLTEEEFKEVLDEIKAQCNYIPFEIKNILKEIACNFIPDLYENNKKYNLDDLIDDLNIDSPDLDSSKPDPFENINLSNKFLFTENNCISSIFNIIESFNDLNDLIFDLEEEKAELFDDAFLLKVRLESLQGRYQYLTDEDFSFELFSNTDNLLTQYQREYEFYTDKVKVIFDFVTGNQRKINEWNEQIPSRTVDLTNAYFNINLNKYHFDRSDVEYANKRNNLLSPIENYFDDFRSTILHSSFFGGAESESNRINVNVSARRNSIQNSITEFINSEEYKNTVIRYEEIENELEEVKRKRNKEEKKLRNFQCPDSVPSLEETFSSQEKDQTAPILMSNPNNVYTPINIEYWRRWATLATIVNLTNPAQFWPVGIVIPTPSGLIKIPMPIIWNALAVIPTPTALIVIFLGLPGVCPSPFVMILDCINQSTRFVVSLRGPKTIRGPRKTNSKISDKTIQQGDTQFGSFVTEGQNLFDLPLVEDDLPDFSRLSISNIPFSFINAKGDGMLTAFNKAGKKGGGFFENAF